MRKLKTRGFKLIFTTDKSFSECESVLDDAIGQLTNRKKVDYVLDMSNDEIDKEFEKLYS